MALESGARFGASPSDSDHFPALEHPQPGNCPCHRRGRCEKNKREGEDTVRFDLTGTGPAGRITVPVRT